MRVLSKTGRPTSLRRPIQQLYPLEVCSKDFELTSTCARDTDPSISSPHDSQAETRNDMTPAPDGHEGRSRRQAAIHARDRIFGCMTD